MLPAGAGAAEPYFDVRDGAKPVTPPADTRAFERRAGASVDLDPATRTPRVVAKLDGTLTGPADGAAATIGLRYVREHLDEFGLSESDLDTLEAPTVQTVGGIRQVRWRQAVDGVRAADSELRVNVTGDGRVLSVLGSPAHDLPADTTPDLSAGEAVRAVQADVGVYRSLRKRSGVRKVAYDDGTTAKLALFNGGLAWRVTYRAGSDAVYDSMVDARSGKVLRRANLVKNEAKALVWDNHPGASYGGEAQEVDLSPWLTSATTLEGPNVRAFMDLDDNDRVGAGEQVAPGSYPFQSSPTGSGCSALPCSWTGSGTSWQANRQQNAVQAFYLANLFHDHLTEDPIGFHGFEGADKVELQTDDGAGKSPMNLNNANMFTPPDGQSPVMQMYLWSSTRYRSMNGGDDASILYHEYTHGLTNRLVTDADGAGALNSAQAGAMGEGWSDFYAKDFLVSQWPLTDTSAPGEVHMGEYTDAVANTIRNQALDCPVGSAGTTATICPGRGTGDRGGFTYGDFGKIDGVPEVHSDGEIWAETLWDLRDELGATDAVRLITAALKLSPPEPSFLDMRNAILQADGGTYRARIWNVFAKRGMGYFASAKDGNDTAPIEDFSLPPAPGGPTGTISGKVTDPDTTLPIQGATVSIGGNSAGPDALATTTSAAGTYSLTVPTGTYPNVIVGKAGYQRTIVSKSVAAGSTVTLDASLRRDWAARDGGAQLRSTAGSEYASYGCGPGAAIDNSQSTAWSTDYKAGTTKPLVVELPQAVNVTEFGIDPAAGCGDSNNASMASYTIETSPDNVSWTTQADGAFDSSAWRKMNLVPASASGVRFVRLTPKTPWVASASFLDVSEFAVYGRAVLPAPDTTILSGPAEGSVDSATSPTFTFGSDQPGSTFECKLDAGAFAACPASYTFSVGAGGHTLLVRAINFNGLADPTPASRTWTVDASRPDATLTSSPPDFSPSATATFTFTLTPNTTSATCVLDGVSYDCLSGTFSRTVADGPHAFKVTASNAVGDDPSPATRSFTVDTRPPALSITGATVTDDSVTFTFSAPDATPVAFSCTFNGRKEPCTSSRTYAGLLDGTYTLNLVATDAAGNTAAADRTITISVPTRDAFFTQAPPAATADRAPVFRFASSSPQATFECALDAAGFSACTSPVSFADNPLAEGAHSFAVRAVGPGARRGTPARADFTVDLTPPQTFVTLAPPPLVTTDTFTLAFGADEQSTFVCTLDGVDEACASPWTKRVPGGAHTVLVTAVDAAGNADPTPERVDFTVSVPVVAATPTPTPWSTSPPPPRAKALTSATAARTASLKTLRKQKKLRLSVRTPAGAKVAAEAKLGSRSLGKATRTASGPLTLKLSAARLKAARRGSTITLRITAKGTNLAPVTRTLKVKLKT